MQIEQETHEKAGRFFIRKNNHTIAEMDYELPSKNILLITHTEVNESIAGKGIGKQLVSAAVGYARDNHFVIKATCSFAQAVLEETNDFADVYYAGKSKS